MPSLTPREQEVLRRLTKGETSKQIARDLNLSPRTVEVHRGNVLHKMGVHNTVALVRKILETA
jgi:two-component system response regulator FixJ